MTTSQSSNKIVNFVQNMKGLLSGLRQFLAIDNSLKKMKKDFYFMLEAFLILELFTFLS